MPFLSALPTVDPQSVVDGAKLWSGPGYIDGLQIQWVSATAVTVSSGRAYIPSVGYYLDAPNAIPLTGLVLTASTWYHLYLYNNAGTPAVECVTTAPAAPYSGTARAKTGDTSRRYVGSVLTDGTGNIYNFISQGSKVNYYYLQRILSTGTATVRTTVSGTGALPPTAILALLHVQNQSSANSVVIDTPESGNTGGAGIFALSALQPIAIETPCASQTFIYEYTGATSGGGCMIDVLGYTYGR